MASDFAAAGMPQDPKVKTTILKNITGRLVAWDPFSKNKFGVCNAQCPGMAVRFPTAGNLVFEGTADGHFEAYRADTGEKVCRWPVQTSVMAGPVSYEVKGEQYLAVLPVGAECLRWPRARSP